MDAQTTLIERRRDSGILQALSRVLWSIPHALWLSLPPSWRVWTYKQLIWIGKRQYPSLGFANQYAFRLPFEMFAKVTSDSVERDALAFVWKYTTIPVPRIIDFVHDAPDHKYYLITSRIEGEQLGKWLSAPEHPDTTLVVMDIQNALSQLRSLPAPTTKISGLYGRHFYCPRVSQSYIGPFEDMGSFHAYLFTVVHGLADMDSLRKLAQKSHTKSHRICFTHGDLNNSNILVKDDRVVGIVDWHSAGWLPEYWDHTAALWHAKRWKRMQRLIQASFPPYDDEVEVERALWKETDRWS